MILTCMLMCFCEACLQAGTTDLPNGANPTCPCCCIPPTRDQVLALASLGVRLVVTLTEETPLPVSWFNGTGVDNLFVPVPNYEPPRAQQMDRIMGGWGGMGIEGLTEGGHIRASREG